MLLADIYLADVKAGLMEDAGWREPEEVGLDPSNLETLGSDIEKDKEHGRVRISRNASLDQVEEANQIIDHRRTIAIEQMTLLPAIENQLPRLWNALKEERFKGPALLVGFSSMLRFTAYLLDSYRSIVPDKDPACLGPGSIGAASLILEAVGINVSIPTAPILSQAGLEVLFEPDECGPDADAAKDLAIKLAIPSVAVKVGLEVVTVMGAAWATVRFLERLKVSVLTEEGQKRLAERFWEGIELQRTEIVPKWNSLLQRDDLSEVEQISLLLWTWPEVL